VFVESESKKVGSLRVPDCVMDRMRASACVALDLARPLRVQLLMEDYAHFVHDAAPLNAQLSHLTDLHGHQKIGRWHALAEAGEMHTLVDELLAEHYDPAYLRSIGRNFVLYEQAEALTLDGIDEAAMERAALRLIA
jgi:tRNA 2-selenouridine synthase